jgi:hypothetical protein
MGYEGELNFAEYGIKQGASKAEIHDTATMGGFLQYGFDISDDVTISVGGAYTSSSNKLWDKDDAQMALFVQPKFKFGNLNLTPEIGLFDFMKDTNDNKQGSIMYFGTQLSYEF